MQKIIRLAALAAAFVAIGAQAQVYVEGSYIPTKITVDDVDGAFKPHLFAGTVGYGVHPHLAIEGMLGLGTKKSTNDGVEMKYKSIYGVFLKPRYQLSDAVEVFARLGYAKTKLQATDSVGTGSDSSSSVAWGLGANYAIDKDLYLTGGYNQLYKKDGFKNTGFNIGLGYKF